MRTNVDFKHVADVFAKKLDALLTEPEIATRTYRYFDPQGPFAASSFEEEANPPTELTADDFLALSFLDVPLKASSHREILRLREPLEDALGQIDPKINLWEVEHDDPTYRAAEGMWNVLLGVPNIGPTRASKLMARKRPRLIPIWDSRIDDFFGNPYWTWTPLSLALRDESRRAKIEKLRRAASGPSTTSILRVLDVAIWASAREGWSEKAPLPVHADIGL